MRKMVWSGAASPRVIVKCTLGETFADLNVTAHFMSIFKTDKQHNSFWVHACFCHLVHRLKFGSAVSCFCLSFLCFMSFYSMSAVSVS